MLQQLTSSQLSEIVTIHQLFTAPKKRTLENI